MNNKEIATMYTKYVEKIPTKANVIESFNAFKGWLSKNCTDKTFLSSVLMSSILVSLDELKKRQFTFKGSQGWNRVRLDEFYTLLHKLKEADRQYDADTNPFKIFNAKMFEFIELEESPTMYLYYWHILYTDLFSPLLYKQKKKVEAASKGENEEEVNRYFKNAEQTSSTNTTSTNTTQNSMPSTDEEIATFANKFTDPRAVVKSYNNMHFDKKTDWAKGVRWCAIHNTALKSLQHRDIIDAKEYTKYMKELVEIRFLKFPIGTETFPIFGEDELSDMSPNEDIDAFAESMFTVAE